MSQGEQVRKRTILQLKKRHRAQLKNPASKYGIMRWISEVSRSDLQYGAGKALSAEQLNLLSRPMRKSKLMDYWYPQRLKGAWIKLKDREFRGEIGRISLRNLSLHHDPVACFSYLRQLAALEARAPICRIDFEDMICQDLSPYMILSEFWNDMLPIFIGGKMDIQLQKVLTAVDLNAELEISLNGVEELSDIWAFPILRRRRAGSSKSTSRYRDIPTRDIAGDKFCSALDGWLNQLGYGLTEYGRSAFYRVIGELLENAERHSDGERRDGSWSISGYMAKQQEGDDCPAVFRVHIGIVSIGDTFFESHSRSSAAQKEKVSKYVAAMRAAHAVQSDETLVTLACLQDGVTCVPEADDDDRGGYGLMEMVELICQLAGLTNKQPPAITIVSGDSCIQLRNPYHASVRVGGSDHARVQWFNVQNSAKHPPDSRWVFDLPEGLPGTVVAISFVLDPEHLERGINENGKARD